MSLPYFSETQLTAYATPQIVERGRAYYTQGRVTSLVCRGTTLFAEVEGSEELAYQVCCTFEQDGSIVARCTCPYDWGGWCKHIVAACLALLFQPETIEKRPSLERLLANLTREQLHNLVLELVAVDPLLVRGVERALDLQSSPETAPAPQSRALIDSATLRRQVYRAIHSLDQMSSSDAYWHVDTAVNKIRQLLAQVWTLIRADRGSDALPALEIITETYLQEWETLDDSGGEASSFFFELGAAWTEAVLSVELTPQERLAQINRLKAWQKQLSDYGVDDAFECAETATRQGWDYAPLQRVLQGKITRQGAWRGEPPSYADDLACTRLAILERRGRTQEYLFLAQAEGQDLAYTIMLVRLNRIQEAIDYGLEVVNTQQDALALATALYEQGEREQSLHIARHGLTLNGPDTGLARWLREQAMTLNRHELALTAAEYALRVEVNLDNYLYLADLLKEQWPQRRTELLAEARQARSASRERWVAIFLHEQLFDDAIYMLESYTGHELLARVADIVATQRPDWVIQVSHRQAASIMDSGQAQSYQLAVNWLQRARDAYRLLQQEAEWRLYLDSLLHQHKRKHKLVPMLEALRA
ncbi:MAG TPA: hypothetical protein VGF67_11875 [Ktedonobacteraceae bacterium]|jgi:uncharacterized Zn finger protein